LDFRNFGRQALYSEKFLYSLQSGPVIWTALEIQNFYVHLSQNLLGAGSLTDLVQHRARLFVSATLAPQTTLTFMQGVVQTALQPAELLNFLLNPD